MGSTSESLPEPFPETPDAVESADWGDRTADVTHQFDDGGFLVSFDYAGGKYDPLAGGLYYVPPGAADTADETWHSWHAIRGSYKRNERERRGVILGRLNARTGFWWSDSGDSKCIPVSVASDGQKAIAAYLFAVHQQSPATIAESIGKATSTVRQYLSDYKAGRTG